MSLNIDGGLPAARLVAVGSTPTLIFPARAGRPYRSAMAIQVVGTADVFVGGAAVAAIDVSSDASLASAGNNAPAGLYFNGVPNPQTTPPTVRMIALATTNAAVYGVAASGQTGYVIAYEEVDITP